MPPIPDIVSISKLDTQFFSSPEYIQHIQYVSGSRLERRRVAKEENWSKVRKLGRGTFGEVWLQRCIQGDSTGKVRAVKRVQRLESNHYYRELEAIALFSHSKYEQCFVKSYGWYDDEDSIFITMEYLANGDLHRYLGSPLLEVEGQNIVSQVLEGLVFMHSCGFAHRDLKPANLLVVCRGPNWWVKIADFGISKHATEEFTALRTLTGTPAFAAPEVLGFIQSDSYTNAVDIWSLGVIAFLILTGETLFTDPRRLGQYVIGSFEFPSDTLLANKVGAEGCAFIRMLMAPKSEDRPGAKESLQNPWLTDLKESAALETQRTIDTSKPLATELYYPEAEASASWSTQNQSSAIEPYYRESVSFPETAVPELRSEVSTQVYMKVPATLTGHLGTISGVAFSPDGKIIASTSCDKTVRLWDSSTGSVRNTLEGHLGAVIAVAFSPDGKLIATSTADKLVKFWDSSTGAIRNTLEGYSAIIIAMTFTLDCKLLMSGSDGKIVRLWNSYTSAAYTTLEGHLGTITTVAFSPDGDIVASGSYDKTVRLWDSSTGAPRVTLRGHRYAVVVVAFSPNCKLIASGSEDKTVRLWNLATGTTIVTLEGHNFNITAIAFSPNGKLLASGSEDYSIKLWNVSTWTVHDTFYGHEYPVTALAFSPDSKLIASGSSDDSVKIWESTTLDDNAIENLESTTLEDNLDWLPLDDNVIKGLGLATLKDNLDWLPLDDNVIKGLGSSTSLGYRVTKYFKRMFQ